LIQIWPDSFDPRKLTFFSNWNGSVLNFAEAPDGTERVFYFGYLNDNGESRICRAVAVIEEHNKFSLETSSMLWRIAEISVERQDKWIVFSREQNDLSTEGLEDFLVDSKNFLKHFRDEGDRLNSNKN
jgi:hypothetical protein